MTTRSRRIYDHRVKEQIIRTRNADLFPELGIPRSTAVSWIRRGLGEVVSVDDDHEEGAVLRDRIVKLENRISMLTALLRLVFALQRVSGFKLDFCRVPSAAAKRILLGAVNRARQSMPLSAALRVLRLSPARYHAWVRAEAPCALDDRSNCPRSMPQRLTYDEVEAIGDMVQSTLHRHMSIRALALHAQRTGKVFAHPTTWAKLIREHGWRRPRLRLYPPKPKVGVRATAPNEMWHVDASILRLLDGTKAYLHSVIDNFSRRILAWTIAGRLEPMNTGFVLARAASNLEGSAKAAVCMDSGIENINGHVDKLFEAGTLERVIAQIDVSFSNSMIEAWFRSIKHQWLFLHQLNDLATVKRLVEFYVVEHNEVLPHSAFRGQTPDEIYFGQGNAVPGELAAQRQQARRRRLQQNQEVACSACPRSSLAPKEDIAA